MKHLLCLMTLIAVTNSLAQNSTFPEAWQGTYEGEMILANANRPNDTVHVNFDLAELETDSVWTYKMEFVSDKWGTIVKDYLIRATSKANKVDYLLDEQNGIVMELTLMNDCFYGMYEVSEMIYTTSIRKMGDELFFELFAASTENPKISEVKDDETDSVFSVASTKPLLVQSALFRRRK